MGLHSVDHADDPWHHKAYDLYRPLYTGGGTFEKYLKNERYKRDLVSSTKLTPNRNMLTPDILERLLRITSSYKKNYPELYKSVMGLLSNDKSTTITVTPPEVPQDVSYRNLELAAAEINPLETLIDTYEQDLQNILQAQRQKESHEPLIRPYAHEFNFWGNSQEVITANPSHEETNILQQTSQQLGLNPDNEQTSFWENSKEILKTFEQDPKLLASPENLAPNEAQSYWENSQETLNTLTESQLFLENPEKNTNEHLLSKNNSKEILNEFQSYWENSQEILKNLNEQNEFLDKPQEPLKGEQNVWQETPEEIVGDVHSLPHETLTSVNKEQNFWESPTVSLEPSALQKRNSFWTELEEEEQQNEKLNTDDLEPIFDFDEDYD